MQYFNLEMKLPIVTWLRDIIMNNNVCIIHYLYSIFLMRIKIIAILYVGNFNNITLEHIDS